MRKSSGRSLSGRAILVLLMVTIYGGWLFRELGVRWREAESPAPDFDGPPVLVPVDGTGVKYVANSSSVLLCIGREYYLLRNGIWFQSPSPDGPYSRIDGPPSELMDNSPVSVR